MWLVNMNCLGVLGKKLAGVNGGKIVKNSIFFRGLPMDRGWLGRVV